MVYLSNAENVTSVAPAKKKANPRQKVKSVDIIDNDDGDDDAEFSDSSNDTDLPASRSPCITRQNVKRTTATEDPFPLMGSPEPEGAPQSHTMAAALQEGKGKSA